jgi:hypothetical protein
MIVSLRTLLTMRNISDKRFSGSLNTHFLLHNFVFFENHLLWYNVKRRCRAGQATDDYMAYAHCTLDNYGYRYTHRICKPYCFSTATIVRRTCLGVKLCAFFLSFVVIFILFTQYMIRKLIAGLCYLFQRSKFPHGSVGGRI